MIKIERGEECYCVKQQRGVLNIALLKIFCYDKIALKHVADPKKSSINFTGPAFPLRPGKRERNILLTKFVGYWIETNVRRLAVSAAE